MIDGVRIIPLPCLIELKLASGTSAPASRGKDLADVYALMAVNDLPRVYAVELDVSVRATGDDSGGGRRRWGRCGGGECCPAALSRLQCCVGGRSAAGVARPGPPGGAAASSRGIRPEE